MHSFKRSSLWFTIMVKVDIESGSFFDVSLNNLIDTAIFNLNINDGLFLIVANNKPKKEVTGYPIVSEFPLIVASNKTTFFYRGNNVYRTDYLDSPIHNLKLDSNSIMSCYRICGNEVICDIVDYKFKVIVLNRSVINPLLNKIPCKHNPLLDI